MSSTHRLLGAILLEHGVLSEEHLAEALEYRDCQGCRLGEALVAMGLCTEAAVARALAEQNRIRFVDLSDSPPAREAMRLIPRELAMEYGIVPVEIERNRLVVAARDPYDLRIDEVVRRISRLPAVVACGIDGQLRDVLSRYDEFMNSPWSTPVSIRRRGREGAAPAERRRAETVPAVPRREPPPPIRRVDDLLADAVRKRAREIYLRPDGEGLSVSFRIDGQVHPMPPLPQYRTEAILSRLRALSGIQRHLDAVCEEGTCRARVDGRTVELHVASFREAGGELLSIRVEDPESIPLELEHLGLTPAMLSTARALMVRRSGLTLVAGPSGSGKPTTLLALLSRLRSRGDYVLSLEQTFERKLNGVAQVRMGAGATQTTAQVLEACLEHRHDAVLVGELPDRAAAEVACRAAAAGQRLLAGSYAGDAVEAVTRLLELGVAPELPAASLDGVLAQRLLRRVCDRCAEEYFLPPYLERALRARFDVPQEARFRRGAGCPECHYLGTRGCIGVFELLEVDDEVRKLLMTPGSANALREAFRERGFRGLEEDAFRKACSGLIAPEELLRLGMDVAAALDRNSLTEPLPEEASFSQHGRPRIGSLAPASALRPSPV